MNKTENQQRYDFHVLRYNAVARNTREADGMLTVAKELTANLKSIRDEATVGNELEESKLRRNQDMASELAENIRRFIDEVEGN